MYVMFQNAKRGMHVNILKMFHLTKTYINSKNVSIVWRAHILKEEETTSNFVYRVASINIESLTNQDNLEKHQYIDALTPDHTVYRRCGNLTLCIRLTWKLNSRENALRIEFSFRQHSWEACSVDANSVHQRGSV